MSTVGVPDVKGLEGRKKGENAAPQSRDFFWDSVTLFVVTAIVALTAIDVVSEFVRGSEVQCFFNNTASSLLKNVPEYVNEKCAASLPAAEYLPAFIVVHALLILAPHYIWLNLFGADLDFFFRHVSELVRTRDPKTGDYPQTNYIISKQLEDAFTYRSNSMYILYLLKLIYQLLVSAGGFAIVIWLFTDFNDTFYCPSELSNTFRPDWPLPNQQVMCVFTSLRLLHKIWIIYLVLLGTAIICLFVAIIWLLKDHVTELGIEYHAKFSFQTSLPLHRYIPQLPLFRFLSGLGSTCMSYRVLSYIPSCACSSPYRIRSDYDFLMIKLFRTDGGLAYILRETDVLRCLKDQNDDELARVSIHKSQYGAFTDQSFLLADLGWKEFREVEFKTVMPTTLLVLPPHIRGVVLGFSARCGYVPPPPQKPPSSPPQKLTSSAGSEVTRKPTGPSKSLGGALCIVFDSESLGFPGALARVFLHVTVLNFSHSYSDYENPVRVNANSPEKFISMTTPHDILTTDREVEFHLDLGDGTTVQKRKTAVERFYEDFIEEIWKPGYIYSKQQDMINAEKHPKDFEPSILELSSHTSDYVVIGPISSHQQIFTVNMFLLNRTASLSNDAMLLTIRPLEISGVNVESQFRPYTPLVRTINFKELHQRTPNPNDPDALNHNYSWPPDPNPQSGTSNTREAASFEWEVKTGDTKTKFEFCLYLLKKKETGADDHRSRSPSKATNITSR